MGKYMRKAKTAGDTAVMEMSQSSLGVRTRARTLALQSTAASTAAPENPDSCYLELRSRRLEKQPPQQHHNSRKGRRRSCVCQGQEHSEECCEAALVSCSFGAGGLGIVASSGENNFDTEARDSLVTRESTPCSSTRAAEGSSTRRMHLRTASQRVPLNAVFVSMPTALELEDFFAIEEQSMQRHFIEKYNFDFVNDSPLPGCYEWVKASP